MEQDQQQHQPERIGLLGGTFDPIHYGHLVIAEEVRTFFQLSTMVFVPSGQPPHKQGRHTTPARHRLAMLELAIASNPQFMISRAELERPGPSYLADTLQILREQWGSKAELYFVLGWDSLLDLPFWHNPGAILHSVNWLVAAARPGYIEKSEYNTTQLETHLPGITQRVRVVPAPLLDISSTELRRRVAEGKPIKYQLPEPVEQYIRANGLYRS